MIHSFRLYVKKAHAHRMGKYYWSRDGTDLSLERDFVFAAKRRGSNKHKISNTVFGWYYRVTIRSSHSTTVNVVLCQCGLGSSAWRRTGLDGGIPPDCLPSLLTAGVAGHGMTDTVVGADAYHMLDTARTRY